MNPNKFRACEFLIQYHEQRNDKIIVFCNNLIGTFALEHYATKLNKPYINGQTSQNERLEILQNFKLNPKVNTIFVSGVLDASFDLPDVNVLIEITKPPGCWYDEYEDLEDDRLGPFIGRNKGVASEKNSPLFYSLVSLETMQVAAVVYLERYLASQGYVFKILTELDGMEEVNVLSSV
jgi:DNA excision repair protein ERCC-3